MDSILAAIQSDDHLALESLFDKLFTECSDTGVVPDSVIESMDQLQNYVNAQKAATAEVEINALCSCLDIMRVYARTISGANQLVSLCPTLVDMAKSVERVKVQLAATKVLTNTLTNAEDKSMKVSIAESDLPLFMLDYAAKFVAEEVAEAYLLFLYFRLLILLSLDSDATKSLWPQKLFVVADLLEYAQARLVGAETDSAVLMVAVIEGMRLIYQQTMELGPLGDLREPNEEEAQLVTRVAAVYKHFLFLPEADRYNQLKAGTVLAMINLPNITVSLFPPEETLQSLISILRVQVTNKSASAGSLIPILIILNSIAKGIPRSRPILKEVFFPGNATTEPGENIDPPAAYKDDSTLGGILMKLMTNVNEGVNHFSSQLLYTVCDEDHEELTRLCGVGYSAGFLHSKGLLGAIPGVSFNQPAKDVTVREFKPEREPTEEEAQEWMRRLDEMEKKGVIKVVRKSDKEEQ